jgi:FAD/FMN-containing dehydrogenase
MGLPNLNSLHSNFSGEIVLPDDERYQQARSSFIRKGTPEIILFPKSVKDVVTAVRYVQDVGMVLSVRSGGHSGAGWSTNDGGAVLDLTFLSKVKVVDSVARRVRIGAGAHWGEVAQTLKTKHLALSSGDTKSVGVGGLTLGGGIGWMVRKYGLTIDSLVSAEIVTATGDVLHVDDATHPDLFWALRGGGGNFGVVTSLEFTAQKVQNVVAGTLTYKRDSLEVVLRVWRDLMRSAPEELTTMLMIIPGFGDMPPTILVTCCWAGENLSTAKQTLEPLLSLESLISETLLTKSYADVLEEAHVPPGVRIIVKNGFVPDFHDDLLRTIVSEANNNLNLIMQIRSLGGAMNTIAPQATAFAHRQSEALLISPFFVPLTAESETIEKALGPWRSIAPFTQGSYVNFLSEVDPDELTAAYPQETQVRLAQVKKKYDPHNFFNQNYNITPAI